MSDGSASSTTVRPTLTLVRANAYDVTPAIPRALDAGAAAFSGFRILCWDREGGGTGHRSARRDTDLECFDVVTPPRSLRTVLDTMRYALWVLRRLLRLRPEFVQACDFESAVPAAVASLVTPLRLVYDMRDPVAESYRMPSTLRRCLYVLDWLVMGRAAAFVVPAPERIPYLGRWGRRRPVAVVRNTCRDRLDDVRPPAGLSPRLSEDSVRIAFLGYLVGTRGADWLIDLCEMEAPRVELLAAGVCRSEELRERLRTTTGVQWLGKRPRPEALGLMRAADVVALLYDPTVPVNRMAAPNKFYEALMVGRPVLVSRGMLQAREVEEGGLGFVIRYGDSEALLDALEALRDPEIRNALGHRCRDHYLDSCRLEEDLERYRGLYRSLVTSTPGG